jgi:hypothetical protein
MTAIPARKLHDKNCRFWSGRSAARRSARRGAAVSGCAGAGGRVSDGWGGKGVFEWGSDGGKRLGNETRPGLEGAVSRGSSGGGASARNTFESNELW